MSMLVYLAGPYTATGDKSVDDHIEQARRVAVELWDKGYYVITPHLNTAHFEKYCQVADWSTFMEGDLRMIAACDVVVLLPGWRQSRGACIERNYALRRGKVVCEYPNLPGRGQDDALNP